MKILALVVVLALVVAAGAGFVWYLDPFGSDSENDVDLAALTEEFQGSACRQSPASRRGSRCVSPSARRVAFLRAFGRQVAGIRQPPRAYGDLARGGTQRGARQGLPARARRRDERPGRHFAGIVVATTFGGGQATRLISIFARRDPLSSPDGQLTEEGIEFAEEVIGGDLGCGRDSAVDARQPLPRRAPNDPAQGQPPDGRFPVVTVAFIVINVASSSGS